MVEIVEQELHKLYTLVYVLNKDKTKILLGLKKRGFGKGRWNGFGGKVEKGETIEQGALRELKEESNLDAKNLEKKGVIYFKFEGDPVIMDVHLYTTTDVSGDLIETDEMLPKWYNVSDLPYSSMWPDDPIWHPWFFEGKIFTVKFFFKADLETITGYKHKFASSVSELDAINLDS
ncbi:hypothetical protein H4219_001109 [Mycoemilia scoparia]|uniref:Oxidized purine nucleoside triphosphate hydrolase n=1 Tax=Mycoemilia scoparia TaxID=417184 RepID=A0A9W8A103_9FUNG|nr:hypothetical protein H4219_001109 [Mycoemilia scoparia]